MNENQTPNDLSQDQKLNWFTLLHQKEAYVTRVGNVTGKAVGPALREIERQRSQVTNENTITKSGGDD